MSESCIYATDIGLVPICRVIGGTKVDIKDKIVEILTGA